MALPRPVRQFGRLREEQLYQSSDDRHDADDGSSRSDQKLSAFPDPVVPPSACLQFAGDMPEPRTAENSDPGADRDLLPRAQIAGHLLRMADPNAAHRQRSGSYGVNATDAKSGSSAWVGERTR